MNHKYKPGDRVLIANTHVLPKEIRGKTVTIKNIINYSVPCYLTEEYSNWIIGERHIIGYAHKENVVITTDGHRTVACLYNGTDLIRSAEARCSPEDAFSFEVGARLAFSRLLPGPASQESAQPKYKPMQQLRIRAGSKVHHHIRPDSIVTVLGALTNQIYRVTGPKAFGIGHELQSVHEDDLSPL